MSGDQSRTTALLVELQSLNISMQSNIHCQKLTAWGSVQARPEVLELNNGGGKGSKGLGDEQPAHFPPYRVWLSAVNFCHDIYVFVLNVQKILGVPTILGCRERGA